MSLDGDLTEHFLAIAAGRYRVRVHARGRDTHFDLGVTEPTETYLIQLTTTTSQFAGITRLHKIDDAHTVAVTAPTTKQRPQIDAEHIYLLNEGKTYARWIGSGLRPMPSTLAEKLSGVANRPGSRCSTSV
ncbi:hypothetical protein [Nocardia salmonicida]|uniref:hypothetical protein n=1 Tax=Nocardia salmonicida TaxID=53431 RepID=UPI003CE9678D